VTCQIVIAGDWSGCTIPYAENLQGISTEIQDGLEFDIKFAILSAAKHTARACEHPLNPDSQFTRLCAEVERIYDHGC
jgi:hypothetical protein